MDILPSTFWEFAAAIVVLAIVAVTVKVGITLDINRWRELSRERLKERIQMTCPHTSIAKKEGGIEVQSWFLSPSGTLMYHCSRCGMETADSRIAGELMETYSRDPKLYKKRLKKLDRLKNKL